MKIKKITGLVIMLLIVSLILVGCGGGGRRSGPPYQCRAISTQSCNLWIDIGGRPNCFACGWIGRP